MTDSLDPIVLNFVYAAIGGVMTIVFMLVGCKVFNRTVCFNINEELSKGNVAVGLMIAGLFIGIGVATGLVIGLGLN